MEKVISEQRRKDLEETIKLYQRIDAGYINPTKFQEYNVVYGMTNECLDNFFNKFTLPGDKGLCVLASGDQMLDLIYGGVIKMDTFDINRLTEYYALGFKTRAVQVLNYDQYGKLFNFSLTGYQQDLENFVIENMEEEYRWFWQELFYRLKESGLSEEPSVFNFAVDVGFNDLKLDKCNIYMNEQNNYKILQKQLLNAKISFKVSDVKDLPTTFGKYDVIFLSNIFDYYYRLFPTKGYLKTCDLAEEIYKCNLEDNGEMIMTQLDTSFVTHLLGKYLLFNNERNYCNNELEVFGWKKERKPSK